MRDGEGLEVGIIKRELDNVDIDENSEEVLIIAAGGNQLNMTMTTKAVLTPHCEKQ